ncbi:tripartite tricarboxylate transporter TctB family protein [Nitratireductor sp. CH_MIT9313-5]|uniref:tripartite tricarboxylate transporter TctB family protein n=1 Tax=Nitratireductor sp. CH_MIT9313-5 TaxID=3107764 RepID=UPI00300AD251
MSHLEELQSDLPDRETGTREKPALADLLVPVFIFVFAAVVVGLALTFDRAPAAFVGFGMQPRAFPIFLMGAVIILNLFLIRETIKNPPERREPLDGMVWITIALMGVFALVTTFADMMLALAITIFAKSLLWGERRVWVALALAILTPLTILLFFDLVLEVRFPRGLLTNIYYG